MNALKTLYLISASVTVLSLSCEDSYNPAVEEAYVKERDLNDLDREMPDTNGRLLFTKRELQRMKLFMHHCNRCHPAGEKGKGPSLVDKKILPDFLVHFQIRNGLGDMPAFKENELPKEDVKRIISFVRLLRKNQGPV